MEYNIFNFKTTVNFNENTGVKVYINLVRETEVVFQCLGRTSSSLVTRSL